MPRTGKKKAKFKGLDFKKKKEVEVEVKDVGDFVPDTSPVMVLDAEEETTQYDSVEIRKKTLEIKDNINKYYTELCENLWLIQKKQLFKGWGYKSFREYGSQELEFGGTKAIYLASIWNNLAVNQDKTVFDKVMELGWSKGKELARVVTKENLEEWVQKARPLRVEALVKEIRTFIRKQIPNDSAQALENEDSVRDTPVEEEKKTITLTFNYEDYLTISQAYEQIKQEEQNASLPQALAMCARDFLASNDMTALGKDSALQIIARLASVHGLQVSIHQDAQAEQEAPKEAVTHTMLVEDAAEQFDESALFS